MRYRLITAVLAGVLALAAPAAADGTDDPREARDHTDLPPQPCLGNADPACGQQEYVNEDGETCWAQSPVCGSTTTTAAPMIDYPPTPVTPATVEQPAATAVSAPVRYTG